MTGTTWSKFYWSDWFSEPCLRACSLSARGLWMDMLCIAAAHDPIGYVSINGRALTAGDIARMAGVGLPEAQALLSELERNGVFSRDRNGMIFSRRLVKDEKKAKIARKNGKNGGNPSLGKQKGSSPSVNPPDKPPDKGRVNTHKPDTRNQKERNNLPAQPVNPGNGGCAVAISPNEPEAPPGNEFDLVQAECSRALGSQSPVDLVIGPMVELVRKYGQERVNFQLQSESRRQRRKPVKRWVLWAEIVSEKLVDAHGVDPPKLRETGPKIDIGGICQLSEDGLIMAINSWKMDRNSWSMQWGDPPDRNGKIMEWSESKGILLIKLEENA